MEIMKILHINSYYAKSYFYKNLFEEQLQKSLEIKVYIPVSNEFLNNNFNYGEYAKLSYCYKDWERLIFPFKHNKILKDNLIVVILMCIMPIHGFLMDILLIN